MSFSVGIVGLPNAGKSTLFKALTKKQVGINVHPFTTIDPNIGIVTVPDERLEKIAEIIHPQKVTPTFIKFIDIAGLVKGAHKGEGLGNQFLAHIRECDAICEVIRAFKREDVEHIEKDINPKRDIEIIETELAMKDLETIEKALLKLEKEAKKGDKKILRKIENLRFIKQELEKGNFKIWQERIDKEEIKDLNLLTLKPIIYLLNIDRKNNIYLPSDIKHLEMNLKEEEEISELSSEEIKELGITSCLDQLILSCYNILNLVTFFTITGGKEARAWTVKKETPVYIAGGKIHSDFEKKFIRAKVINWKELIKAGSWIRAREQGLIKTVGKDYLVQDGDVIEFKI
ncbi:redox-regulated ATPase YchF [bacterium]|nr:redox-regulated ATPase YchF [bacterium]